MEGFAHSEGMVAVSTEDDEACLPLPAVLFHFS